jgi:hypothetical protein
MANTNFVVLRKELDKLQEKEISLRSSMEVGVRLPSIFLEEVTTKWDLHNAG